MSGTLHSGRPAACGASTSAVDPTRNFYARRVAVTGRRGGPRAATGAAAAAAAPAAAVEVPKVTKPTLFDVPVSNNGARVGSSLESARTARPRDAAAGPSTSRAQSSLAPAPEARQCGASPLLVPYVTRAHLHRCAT